jgi:hypothetical protein
MKKQLLLYCTVSIFMLLTMSALIEETEIAYPENYRAWHHVKTAIIEKESPSFERFGGIHHIYANEKAIKGYSTGKFPEGSVIVFDVLEIEEKDGAILEGKRRFVDVMVKNSKKFAATGGWGYEEFLGESKTERKIKSSKVAETECFNCHIKKKDNDFIFSTYRK